MSPDTSHACFDCVRVRPSPHSTDEATSFWRASRNARDTLVTVALLEPVEPAAGPIVPFVLVQGVIKGGGMDEIVRDATMMGAAIIQPVVTAYTAVKPAFAKRGENVERSRRIAIASAKQSRRATLPDVREPVGLEAAIQAHAADLALMFVEPSAGRDTRSLRTFLGSTRPNRRR